MWKVVLSPPAVDLSGSTESTGHIENASINLTHVKKETMCLSSYCKTHRSRKLQARKIRIHCMCKIMTTHNQLQHKLNKNNTDICSYDRFCLYFCVEAEWERALQKRGVCRGGGLRRYARAAPLYSHPLQLGSRVGVLQHLHVTALQAHTHLNEKIANINSTLKKLHKYIKVTNTLKVQK